VGLLRPLASLLCSAWALANGPPVIGVAAEGTCPAGEAVRDSINRQPAPEAKPVAVLGSDGDVLLSVSEAPGGSDTVRVELRTRTGQVLMTRDLIVRDSSCPVRARSIAVIVHRFLEKLPTAKIRQSARANAGTSARATTVAPPPPPPAFDRLEPRAGFSLDAGLGQDRVVGAALGLAVRPYRHLAAHVFGRLHWPQREPAGEGDVASARHSLNLALAAGFHAGPARVEGGVGGRLDIVSIETEGLPFTHRSRRYNPAAMVLVGASTPIYRSLLGFLTVDFYVLGREQAFVVEGLGEVARTARYGLALGLGLGYGVWPR